MSDVQKALSLLLSTFHKYAKEDGDKNTLSKSEVKELLERELSSNIKQKDLEQVFNGLDANRDGEVDFTEFMTLVAGIAILSHEFITKHLGE